MANQNQTSVSSAQFTELSADNAVYLESLYEQYLQDPQSVDEKYIPYFAQFAKEDDKNALHHTIQEQFLLLARNTTAHKVAGQSAVGAVSPSEIREFADNQMGVQKLITSYRRRGHRIANLDPLGLMPRPEVEELTLAYYGLSEADLDTVYPVSDLNIGKDKATLREIIEVYF